MSKPITSASPPMLSPGLSLGPNPAGAQEETIKLFNIYASTEDEQDLYQTLSNETDEITEILKKDHILHKSLRFRMCQVAYRVLPLTWFTGNQLDYRAKAPKSLCVAFTKEMRETPDSLKLPNFKTLEENLGHFLFVFAVQYLTEFLRDNKMDPRVISGKRLVAPTVAISQNLAQYPALKFEHDTVCRKEMIPTFYLSFEDQAAMLTKHLNLVNNTCLDPAHIEKTLRVMFHFQKARSIGYDCFKTITEAVVDITFLDRISIDRVLMRKRFSAPIEPFSREEILHRTHSDQVWLECGDMIYAHNETGIGALWHIAGKKVMTCFTPTTAHQVNCEVMSKLAADYSESDVSKAVDDYLKTIKEMAFAEHLAYFKRYNHIPRYQYFPYIFKDVIECGPMREFLILSFKGEKTNDLSRVYSFITELLSKEFCFPMGTDASTKKLVGALNAKATLLRNDSPEDVDEFNDYVQGVKRFLDDNSKRIRESFTVLIMPLITKYATKPSPEELFKTYWYSDKLNGHLKMTTLDRAHLWEVTAAIYDENLRDPDVIFKRVKEQFRKKYFPAYPFNEALVISHIKRHLHKQSA